MILETIELPLKYRCEFVLCVLCVLSVLDWLWPWHQLPTDKHVMIAAALRAVDAVHVVAPRFWQAGHTGRRVRRPEPPPLPT